MVADLAELSASVKRALFGYPASDPHSRLPVVSSKTTSAKYDAHADRITGYFTTFSAHQVLSPDGQI
ncbi:MAG: hypothetical protein WA972_11315 [Rhodococcus qingshengii]